MTNKTLLQQALNALEDVNNTDREYDILSLNLCKTINRSIEALRAAIAEPEQTDTKLPPLPKVGPICYASASDVMEYKPSPKVGTHLPGVRDVALWSTQQMQAYAHKAIAQLEQKAKKLPPAVNFDEYLDSRDFYELMQSYRHRSMDAAKEFNAVKYALRKAIAQPKEPSLSKINQLALQYCTSYVSPHYVTFSVDRLQKLIQAITQP